ncbi:DUF1330 domain-containing protein [Ancylobacter sp. 6x-1]|uniref:DUF1330 domain-containing protein n=1 Tax=Ancylobacter crimeensis TaxID=2579147 RepID=A0ABT0DAD0_9HYPH|nr:DUF1330 domain-containing protein [Ancylobacter crimeensis]MCK0196912.1 DUF1330 domain-containing protein [Ancylobacter crimeensis]
MARGYWVMRLDTIGEVAHAQAAVRACFARALAAVARYSGRFLVLGGAYEAPEPPARAVNAVVEFADYATAQACVGSTICREILADLGKVSVGEHIVIEGYAGAQPALGRTDGPAPPQQAAYWILRDDVEDVETYKAFISADAIAIEAHRGWFLVRGGRYEVMAGTARTRNVVLAFHDFAAALACYEAPANREALALRKAASRGEVVIVRGYAGR